MILSEKYPDLVGKLYKITNKTLNLNLIRRAERERVFRPFDNRDQQKNKDLLSLSDKSHQIGDDYCHTYQPMKSHYSFKLLIPLVY